MSDPIWLDSNTLMSVINGDYVLAAELRAFRAQGRALLIVPAVRNEILNGNPLTMDRYKTVSQQVPSLEDRALAEKVMKDLGVQVDMEAAKLGNGRKIATGTFRIDAGQAQRVGYAMQDHVKRPKNLEVPKSLDRIAESDSLVLSQIKASAEARGVGKPQVFTAEKPTRAMVAEAPVYGIEPVRPKSPLPGSGGGAARPPSIALAEYPTDAERGLARFFKDRPVLKQAGLVGVNLLASQVSPVALELIKSHYNTAIDRARQEFQAKCPDPVELWNAARIDDYKRTYELSLQKLTLPSSAKNLGALLAFTRYADRAAAWQEIQARMSRVKLPNGAMAGFNDVGAAYVGAMADLYTQYSQSTVDLRAAADDVQKRAAVLQGAANDLNDMFWKALPCAASLPVVYYSWLDVHNVADTIQTLSQSLASFAAELRGRNADYERLSDKLDQQLLKVSNELARYSP